MSQVQQTSIKRQTRRDIFDGLRIRGFAWRGDLEDVPFLERLWDLRSLPSTDARFRDAFGDVWQHRHNNWDWEDDWLYSDARFDLLGCADEQFLRFCEQLVHPVVRQDGSEAEALVGILNDALRRDGWELSATYRIAGQPVYQAVRTGDRRAAEVLDISLHRRVADPVLFDDHIRRIETGLRADPPAAIGSAKELLETTCKVILEDYAAPYGTRDDVLDLYKKVATELKLNAEAVPDDAKGSRAAQGVLRQMSAAVQNLAELRNALGTGHGRGIRAGVLERHARLAVGASVTVCSIRDRL
jgi:hypothetical protein